MKPPKVVFDTNIFISAIIFGGNPRTCLELAQEGKIEIYISKALLLELAIKLKEKFEWSEERIKVVILGISRIATIIQPTIKVELIKDDPKDNFILEVAKEGSVDFIISGDKKHLLPLRKFEETKIVSATEFIKTFDIN